MAASARKKSTGFERGGERGRKARAYADAELFRGLAAADLKLVARQVTEKRYSRGEAIFHRNDLSDSLFALEEGLVKLVARSARGAGTILYILRPVDIFGELLFSEEKRPFDAIAVTDVVAAALPREQFAGLLVDIPAVSLNFIRILSRRLIHVEKGMSEFSHTWSYQRLATVLLRLCGEFGEETAGGVLLRLSLTHSEIADMIGTTRETVTNQMNRFKRMGLVSSRGHGLVIDRRRLSEFLRAGDSRPESRVPPLPRIA